MALSATDLATALHNALAQKTDVNGNPTPVSSQTQEYASGFIAALKAALIANAPGTITGVTAPGAPLSAGLGAGGMITATPGPMLSKTLVGAPGPQVSPEDSALITYIMTGLVAFAAGDITGSCTNTPLSPGPLAAGAGSGGLITGLTGAGAVAAVSGATGLSGPNMINHYTALINYILQNAQAAYAAGSVVGVCPAAGGPLAAGAGTGGTFS